jgi:hypothetical protein
MVEFSKKKAAKQAWRLKHTPLVHRRTPLAVERRRRRCAVVARNRALDKKSPTDVQTPRGLVRRVTHYCLQLFLI